MTYDLKPYAILKDLLLFYVCICVFFVNLCVALTWRRPQKPKGIRFQGTGVQVAVSCSMGAEMWTRSSVRAVSTHNAELSVQPFESLLEKILVSSDVVHPSLQ